MIRIIDRTLTTFDNRLPRAELMREHCSLIAKTGVSAVEISCAAYGAMEALPEGVDYILHINSDGEPYDGFEFFKFGAKYDEAYGNVVRYFLTQISGFNELYRAFLKGDKGGE